MLADGGSSLAGRLETATGKAATRVVRRGLALGGSSLTLLLPALSRQTIGKARVWHTTAAGRGLAPAWPIKYHDFVQYILARWATQE